MNIKIIDGDFSVCKISNLEDIDWKEKFVFVSKTDDEISLVCKSELVKSNFISAEDGWKCMKITGILDFSMIGVISKISNILAKENISIFVISTYNTDYLMVKNENFERTKNILLDNDYSFI